jgi:hypothetical protein
MNLKLFVLIPLFLMSVSSYAQDKTTIPARLQLYKSLQDVCALLVLNNHSLAVNLTLATKVPLSHICECASLNTVSAMSDQDIAFTLAGEVVTREQLSKTLNDRLKNCALIQ